MIKKFPRPSSVRRSDSHKKTKNRPKTKEERRRQRNLRVTVGVVLLGVIAILIGMVAVNAVRQRRAGQSQTIGELDTGGGPEEWQAQGAPYIDVQLLTPNEYSRPQLSLPAVKYIAIHYTANPGATAQANRNYFENLAQTYETKVSSHFVVGLEGEVIQCIPTSEMSYATNERNVDTISIETCHQDESGVFNDAAYDSVVKLAAWLCTRFGLTQEEVIRHYDVTGKECPKYYVDNPDAWEQMKEDIRQRIAEDYVLQGK